jgi:phosphate transport system substrate-binding protein
MIRLLTLAVAACLATAAAAQNRPVPFPAGASYVLPDGRIALHGNDDMSALIEALDAQFEKTHPGFRFALRLKGSSTAMPALTAGATPIALMGRELWRGDLAAFRTVHDYDPTPIRVAYAGYGPRAGGKTPPAVYINRSNPLGGLTMAQLAQIFTSGAPEGDVHLWSQLGLKGEWASRRIHVYGLRDDGAFATSMRLARLGGMPFTAQYEPLPDYAAIVHAIAADPYGIGILGWLDPAKGSKAIRIVPLAAAAGAPFVLPDKNEVAAGAYPLSSFVTFYVDRAPGKPFAPFIKAYLSMVLSDEGQAIIARFTEGEDGFLPLSLQDRERERGKVSRF